MSRRRKRSRKQGTYFLRNQRQDGWGGWWVCSVTSGVALGYRYTKRFSDAMHFRNFARANRFRKPGEEVRRLVWKWWIFTRTKKVESSYD